MWSFRPASRHGGTQMIDVVLERNVGKCWNEKERNTSPQIRHPETETEQHVYMNKPLKSQRKETALSF